MYTLVESMDRIQNKCKVAQTTLNLLMQVIKAKTEATLLPLLACSLLCFRNEKLCQSFKTFCRKTLQIMKKKHFSNTNVRRQLKIGIQQQQQHTCT